MFSSSLRRVARTCPNATVVTRNTPTTGSTATATFSTRSHQRRYSSSKPPIPPNNGSPTIPASSVKQVGAPRSTDKRPVAESRLSKRKATKGEKIEIPKQRQETKGNEWTLSLPNVPSTQHLNPKDVFVASFFSTHRPISISGPLPPETQIEEFNKIFESRLKKTKPKNSSADVIYTLSNVVQNLDEHAQGQQQDNGVEQKVDIIKALTQHNNAVGQHSQSHNLDGQQQSIRTGNVKMVIEEIAKRFRPFNTPPPPVPAPETDLQGKTEGLDGYNMASKEAQVEAEEIFQARQLEAEIERQDTNTTGRRRHIIAINSQPTAIKLESGRFFTPHTSSLTNPSSNTASLIGPASNVQRCGRVRRGVWIDPSKSQGTKYYTISTKRQRKLKMKKHKYKKLMRKTRNLRRRQDKL